MLPHAAARWSYLSCLLIGLGCSRESAKPIEPVAVAPETPTPKSSASAQPGPSTSKQKQRRGGPAAIAPAIRRAVDATDRSREDRELDAGRKPTELLAFFDVRPGMRVAELGAGRGYTTELLARVVGSTGTVYAHNSPFVLQRFAEAPLTARLEHLETIEPKAASVQRLDREFGDPFPDSVANLDLVLNVLFYHDTVWFEADRDAMNRDVFAALRAGGVYGIVDHSARDGDGTRVAKELHRIEESVVVEEVRRAGFVLVESADFLRNPSDARDWNAAPSAASERRGTSDRFVLKFRKPIAGMPVHSPGGQAGSDQPAAKPNPKAESPVDERPSAGDFTRCGRKRPEICTKEYRPVCAEVDTEVRCVRAPCPSSEYRTYGNACSACSNEKVIGHRPGACKNERR